MQTSKRVMWVWWLAVLLMLWHHRVVSISITSDIVFCCIMKVKRGGDRVKRPLQVQMQVTTTTTSECDGELDTWTVMNVLHFAICPVDILNIRFIRSIKNIYNVWPPPVSLRQAPSPWRRVFAPAMHHRRRRLLYHSYAHWSFSSTTRECLTVTIPKKL
jgi:hypothetical protein